MRLSQSLAALWAFGSVSSGFPSEEDTDEPVSFTLHQELAENTYFRHPSIEMQEVRWKFNGTTPEDIENAAHNARSGKVKNFPGREDSYYLVPTFLGTPGQKVNLDFDTGSSDLWTYSSESPENIRKGHSYYKPGKSRTSKLLKGQKWSISYGDGSSAGGTVYRDTVRLGPVAIKGQAVESAKRVGGSFGREKPVDGIFGSGFTDGNQVRPKRQKVWYENANLKKKVFCARLNHGKPGQYDIGFINGGGKVHYTKVNSKNSYWEFTTQGYSVGGGGRVGTKFNAIADTGTTVAYIPFSAIKHYYRHVPSAQYNNEVGGIIYHCGSKLPDFHIFIGGSRRTIPGKDINAGFVGTAGGSRFCFGGLQSNQGLRGLSILGDVFLKSQYVVFDFGSKRIGFAPK